jgi:hypothetical protein
MEARLTGQNFAITAISPEVQATSRNEITSWSWEVKPKTKSKQYLHLTLTALIRINGNSTPRTLHTFSKAVNAEVTQAQQLESLAGQNWQWLWATLLVPIAGWVWKSKANKNYSETYMTNRLRVFHLWLPIKTPLGTHSSEQAP